MYGENSRNLSLKLQLGYWDLVHCRTLLAVAERFVGVGCSLITSLAWNISFVLDQPSLIISVMASLASTLVCPCRLSFLSYTAIAKYAMCELLLMIWLGNMYSAVNCYSFYCAMLSSLQCVFCYPVCEIMVRIRVCGCVLLTNGSGSCYFRQWLTRRQQKNIFFSTFFASYFLKLHLHYFSKIIGHK